MMHLCRVKKIFIMCVLFIIVFPLHAQPLTPTNWQLLENGHEPLVLTISNDDDEFGSLSLRKNGIELYEQQVTHAELQGACVNKSTGAINVIFTDVMEGVGIEQAYALIKPPHWQLVALPQEDDSIHLEGIESCDDLMSDWTLDEEPVRCECDFNDVIKQQTIDDQWDHLLSVSLTGLYSEPPFDRLMPKLIEGSSELEALLIQAKSDKDIAFESISGERRWVIIERSRGTYQSLSVGLLKQEGQWYLWYYTTGNSKSFNAIENIKQKDNKVLAATLCVEDCDWWGQLADIKIDLMTLTIFITPHDE